MRDETAWRGLLRVMRREGLGHDPRFATLASRLGNRAALDLSARKFFVGGVDSPDERGHDNIVRADVSIIVRVHGRHGVALSYFWSQRKASLPGFPALGQERGTLGIFYTLLAKDGVGIVE